MIPHPSRRRRWYSRLWNWLFPKRMKPFKTVTLPMVLYKHPTREELVKSIVGDKP